MRIVVALGGNALVPRGEPPTAELQSKNVQLAVRSLVPVARAHELVVTHGNGPQVGLLALQAESYTSVPPYPLDLLGAESQGMVGYLIERELRNLCPEREVATLLTLVEVDAGDPAFRNPSKPIGPVVGSKRAERLRDVRAYALTRESGGFRRVVASPEPRRILGLDTVRRLLDAGRVVVCAGGGGVPVAISREGRLAGVEAVIDKDRASALLAEGIQAEMLVLATDVEGVFEGWGGDSPRLLKRIGPADRDRLGLDPGSMGPKIDAALRFASATSGKAAIGRVEDLPKMLEGAAGTIVESSR